MNVDGAIPNLLQGISQQQPQKRLPGQCTDQVNAVNDVVDGWKRRPPTEYIADLLGVVDAGASRWHFYDTGLEQQIICITTDGTLHVFDLDGSTNEVAGAVALKSVLSFTTPEDLSILTIGDYTLFANSKTIPAMQTGYTEVYSDTALIYLKDGGEYGRTYTVHIDGVLRASYTAPGGSTPAEDAEKTGTEYVCKMLYDALVAANLSYTFSITGSIIEIKHTTGTGNIDVTVTDDRGGQFAKIIQRSVIKPSDLPKYATPGHIVQVTGEGTSDKDDYYLKFTIETGTSVFGTEGIWRECAEPELERRLNPNTLPIALIRLPDMSWVLTTIDGQTFGDFTVEHWRYRSAGTEDTNRTPSFVGSPIVFMGTFQDRLGILSDETALFSATNSYFNFFNTTAVTILDSDPVDMPSAGNTVVKLKRMVQHDKNLVIFADKAQFIIPGNKPMTPKDSMVLTTAYESDLVATPVTAGNSILFPITYGNYAGVREFITSSLSDTNSSQPVTAHVPKLISGSIQQLLGTSNFDLALARVGLSSRLYVYKYMWQDQQRQQASWGIWDFNKVVHTMFIRDALVYLVLKRGNTYSLERMDLTDVAPMSMPYNIYLDSRVACTPVGTSLVAPYPVSTSTVVIQGATCAYPGAVVRVLSATGSTLELAESPTGACYVGEIMSSSYEPTMPYIKDASNALISNANLVYGNFLVSFKDTGGITAVVKNPHYEDFLIEYSGRTLGSITNLIGAPVVDSGVFTVPIRKDSKDTTLVLSTSSHLPMNLTGIEWTGDYTKRGRRL